MWNVSDVGVQEVGYQGCVMFSKWQVWDVRCLECGMFEVKDVCNV